MKLGSVGVGADIAVVAREGLLAMSVAAGMAEMQPMQAEITAAAGPKANATETVRRSGPSPGRLGQPGRSAGRGDPDAGPDTGWARGAAEQLAQFAGDDLLSQVVLERMLTLGTRSDVATDPPRTAIRRKRSRRKSLTSWQLPIG